MNWNYKIKNAFNDGQPESLFCDSSAVWLDAETKQRIEHRFQNRPANAYKSDIAVMVDMTQPITRERMKELGNKFGAKHYVVIEQYRFFDREGNLLNLDPSYDEGGYFTHKKKFVYVMADDSLVIYEDDTPVYANDAGVVCTNHEALADSLL